MRILWITYDLPYPPNSGGKQRAYYLMKYLSLKYEIDLYSFYRSENQLEDLTPIKNLVSRLRLYKRRPVWHIRNLLSAALSDKPLLISSYHDLSLVRDLREDLVRRDYDLVHLEFLGVAWVLPWLRKLGATVVFGEENIEYQIYDKYARGRSNFLIRKLMDFDVWKMRRLERIYWRLASANLVVSLEDLKIMEDSGAGNAFLVPNGIDADFHRSHHKKVGIGVQNRALFIGNLVYQQNNEAVRWFCLSVLPKIIEKLPDFKLVVVSGTKPDWISRFEGHLIFRADVSSDFAAFVDEADVFVLPVWIKGGTNIKLLQAMAVGFPIVTTPGGAAGYGLLDGREVLISRTDIDFSKSVVRLLGDSSLRKELAEAARSRALDFDWRISAKILGEVYEKIKS